MKAIILGLIFCILSGVALGQEDHKIIKYNAKEAYIVLLDKERHEVNRRPEGLNAYIEYHTFFKSYKIIYEDSEKKVFIIKLEYLRPFQGLAINGNKDGLAIYGDKDGGQYLVLNFIDKSGILDVYPIRQDEEGYSAMLEFLYVEKDNSN